MTGLDEVFRAVAETAGTVRADLANHAGGEGGTNPSGERQVDADVWADKLFFDALTPLSCVGAYASEEREDVVDCGDGYSVAVDPLDGSSNLASNNAVGTIVGVYDAALPAPGRALVGSAMVLYGPYTTMVVAREDTCGAEGYLVRDGAAVPGEEVTVPPTPTVVGIAGKSGERDDAVDALARDLERDLKLRYGGATVADLGQVLEYGGLFGYPSTTAYSDGKLRVHFEAAPLGYLVEAAGGRSTDGHRSLLGVDPGSLHARTPAFLGTPGLVERVEDALSG
jgi:fructose-1,6-bisphosphatase I